MSPNLRQRIEQLASETGATPEQIISAAKVIKEELPVPLVRLMFMSDWYSGMPGQWNEDTAKALNELIERRKFDGEKA